MPRSRIAPTPSGFLHRGNAFNFLLTEALVRSQGGTLRLRIDDLDAGRMRPQYLEDIFDSLRWLRLVPDEGPLSPGDHLAHYSQLLRIPRYEAMLRRLATTGRVFACVCSRAEVARHAVGGQYAGTCRDRRIGLDADDVVWRFRTEADETVRWEDRIGGAQAVRPHEVIRDFVIRRRDGVAAYHLASLSDDLHYGIDLIVRGADLLESTAAQLLLAAVLNETPFLGTAFFHHPLLTDPSGAKLSKSAGSASLKALREAGVGAEELRAGAAQWYRNWIQARP